MTSNVTVCDLCQAGVPTDRAHDLQYSALSLTAPGKSSVQTLIGPGASAIDLCPTCVQALAGWLHARKAASVTKTTTEPAIAAETASQEPQS